MINCLSRSLCYIWCSMLPLDVSVKEQYIYIRIPVSRFGANVLDSATIYSYVF